jgi:NAD(P)-dependent dehydrogenase (short-subunit alcohol dehydrogenase family)
MPNQRNENHNWMLMVGGLGAALAARKLMQQTRMADLRGQIAFISGGSRGLGFLLAREFARAGCLIAICARDEEELSRAKSDLERTGATVFTVVCDVTDQQQVEQAVAAVLDHYVHIDILVNVAGVIQVGPMETMSVEDFREAMNVMYWGMVYPTLAALPQMRRRWTGRIVNITSIGGKISMPHLLPYNAAKFAAVGFSEGLCAELADEGITVTTVVPGLMRTGSYLNAYFKGDQQREYTWFSLGASLPFLSIDAERAAHLIVQAARRGDPELILTLPAQIGARFKGLFPGLTVRLLSLVDRLLPRAISPQTEAVQGRDVQPQLDSTPQRTLTGLGRSAAERYHQHPGPEVNTGGQSDYTRRE